MYVILERFALLLKRIFNNEKIRVCWAVIFYIITIVLIFQVKLPTIMDFIIAIILGICTVFSCYYIFDGIQKYKGKIKLKESWKEITNEIKMYLPIFCISIIVSSFLMAHVGTPENQKSLEEGFEVSPIEYVIIAVLIGPILEEFLFRFLPAQFIKNKYMYIIISAVIFSGLHVISDDNPLIMISGYLIDALYWGYRYYKTKNILVTISLHMFNNLIAVVLLLKSMYF